MTAILEGIRIIDWSVWYVGPGAAALLADLGADVIHVEQRGVGDQMRALGALMSVPQHLPDGRQITFEYANRNKRGISVDLSKPEGVEVMRRLVEKADMFLTNFRDASAKRAGLSYDDLKQVNPRIIYLSASCFGPRGPDAGAPGLDLVALAHSAMMFAPADGEVAEARPGEPILLLF